MGLDMYALKVKREYRKTALDYTTTVDGEPTATEIAYWRKHNYLHGWMRDLFFAKGGEGDFNCQPVELTLDDLKALEDAIDNDELTYTEGFFFGGDYAPDADDIADYKAFIDLARHEIADGYCVYYDSWW